jgi:post-segregation antitoxin (ccd killing protein)
MTTYPKKQRAQRLSVTVPAELARWVRAEAAANDVPISLVVETAIRRRMALESKT